MEKDVLKQLKKTDQELISDVIDMELFDTGKVYLTREESNNDESNIIQGEGS